MKSVKAFYCVSAYFSYRLAVIFILFLAYPCIILIPINYAQPKIKKNYI